MKVYSREELMAKTMKGMKGPGEGGDDDDDEEGEEEEDVPVRPPSSSLFLYSGSMFLGAYVFGVSRIKYTRAHLHSVWR